MSVLLLVSILVLVVALCAYHRWPLAVGVAAVMLATLAAGALVHAQAPTLILLGLEALAAVLLLWPAARQRLVSAPLLKLFARAMPRLSATEQTALEAGTVGFEGQLFSGRPDLLPPSAFFIIGLIIWGVRTKDPKQVEAKD